MKMKKILTSVLLAVMIFTSVTALLPLTASAAYSKYSSATATRNKDTENYVKKILKTAAYTSADKMLAAEQALGYISTFNMTAEDGTVYALHVNPFTGYVYYENKVTGQILTSNPADLSGISGYINDPESASVPSNLPSALSQIILTFSDTAGVDTTYNSFTLAAARSQISLSQIENGFRLNYTLGETATRFLLPGAMKYDDFKENIFDPIYNTLLAKLEEYWPEGTEMPDFDFFSNEEFVNSTRYPAYDEGDCLNFKSIKMTYLGLSGAVRKWARQIKDAQQQAEINTLEEDLRNIIGQYSLQNPYTLSGDSNFAGLLADMYERWPVTMGADKEDPSDDVIIAVLDQTTAATPASMRKFSQIIRKYCPDYTFADMSKSEKECGYEAPSSDKPVFRMALEYTLDPKDGTLKVSLPAGSVTFDRTLYTLKSIQVLPYFGAGDMNDGDGYVFFPDGSGTVVQYKDFYTADRKDNMQLSSQVYGQDYCMSNISGRHYEQVTMPVYGVVNTVNSTSVTRNKYKASTGNALRKVVNGFISVLEEGSSLATLNVNSDGNSNPYMGAFASYTPYAVDGFNLTETIGLDGDKQLYYVAADTPYAGNYVQRFVMLTDPTIATQEETIVGTEKETFVSSYVGMAAYYRAYLKANGVLSALEDVEDKLPLYIESLGAMDIDSTFLTFPVTKTIPLTTFDDVITMYEELAGAGVTNVNFRLTSYANGGIYSTYPVKLGWERAVGGKKGYKNLLSYAAETNATEGKNLGIYPEFDFMYINYTALFDGISNRHNVSKLLDNRYASKRTFSAKSGTFGDSFRMVIAAEALDKLTDKFLKKYGRYDAVGLSVSTMGSDLSSNFDEDAPVDREQEMEYVQAALAKLADKYTLMMEKGNAYSLKYATHLLEVSIDSSHFRKSSYAVPFIGMVLHGSMNYTGSALNMSGSPDYDLLRSIENGASVYYILCYQNITHMKEKGATNKYYSVDYQNWRDTMIATYNRLNEAIGDLQTANITNHRLLIGERVTGQTERETVFRQMTDEFVAAAEAAIKVAVDDAMRALSASGNTAGLKMTVGTDALYAAYEARLLLNAADGRYTLDETFKKELTDGCKAALLDIKTRYEAAYNAAAADAMTVTFDAFEYKSAYSYLTESESTDENYVVTEYTSDNGNIVVVTYTRADGTTEEFILNYNIFAVTVKYNGRLYTLSKYGFAKVQNA